MSDRESPKVLGRYTLHGKIAQGGMAAVYFGRQQGAAGFSRTVAIKRLHPHLAGDPNLVATILDEARMAARIHHPNVVPALDVVAEEGELLLVMEYVRGESLARLVAAECARGRTMPLPIASAIALGALQGLHAAHDASSERGEPLGIVHRDVSPQNILVGADGVARIIDFGIAKAAGRIQSTRDGVIKGKWGYMAPEQVGGLEPTRAIDVYAMGVVLWELLTGQRLFWANVDAAVVAKVLEGAKEAPSRYAPNTPPELDAIVMRALSRDPSARFPTASDMADALVRVVSPALPRDVGLWVQELARESLAQRAAAVIAIESASDPALPALPPEALSHVASSSAPAMVPDRGVHDEVPTIATQASAISVVTVLPEPSPRRSPLLYAAFGSAVVLLGVGIFFWRSPAPPPTPPVAGAVPATDAPLTPVAPVPLVVSPPAFEPLASAVPLPSASSPPRRADPIPSSRAPSAVSPRKTPPRPPSGMVRFPQPD